MTNKSHKDEYNNEIKKEQLKHQAMKSHLNLIYRAQKAKDLISVTIKLINKFENTNFYSTNLTPVEYDGAKFHLANTCVTLTNKAIDQFHMRNFFTIWYNRLITSSNAKDDYNQLIAGTFALDCILKQYVPLLEGHHIPQYVFDVLFNGLNYPHVNTLHNVQTKYEDYNLYNIVTNFNRMAKDNIKDMNKEFKKLNYSDPILNYDHAGQLADYASNFMLRVIEDENETNPKKQPSHDAKVVTRVLYRINNIFNDYLLKNKVMEINNNGDLCLNKNRFEHRLVRAVHSNRSISYHPDDANNNQIITGLADSMINAHNKNQGQLDDFMGLVMFEYICNYGRYKRYNSYTDNNGINRTLALSPLVFTACIISLFDGMLRPNEKEVSLPAIKLIYYTQDIDKDINNKNIIRD